jgi:rubrerythrin
MTDQAPQIDSDAAYDKLLAVYLAGRDTACTSCNYNLRNVTSGACPECGEPLFV